MKRIKMRGVGKVLPGYTLIEVLIVLAVSGALLVSAASLITGRQQRIRFTQSVVGLEQQLQDTFNDASTGYFPSNGDFSCTSSGGTLTLTSGGGSSTEQGANDGCIFVGKLLHFYVSSTDGGPDTNYRIYTMVGVNGAKSITDKQVKLLGSTVGNPGIVDTKTIGSDIKTQKSTTGRYLIRDTGNPGAEYHSIGVITSFNGSGPNNAVTGNASRVNLYGYNSWDSANGVVNTSGLIPIQESAVICLKQDGNTRPAALIISKQLTIERKIDQQPDVCRL